MSDIFDSEGTKLTTLSWRKKYYGLIKEGHKSRVSPLFIKIIFGLVGLIAITVEFLSGSKSINKNQRPPRFEIPQKVEMDSRVNLPIYDPQRQFSAGNMNGTKSGGKYREPAVAKLQTIKLLGAGPVLTASQVQAELSMGASNGMVAARLTQSLIVGGDEIFPQGTTLYGKGSSNDERLYVEFKKAILPDRTEQKIKAQALDINDQMLGIKGKKISDIAFKIAASSGLIFLSGMADGMKQQQDLFTKPTVQDAALNGVATAASKQSERMLSQLDNEPQKVEVKVKTQIIVMFDDYDGKDQ